MNEVSKRLQLKMRQFSEIDSKAKAAQPPAQQFAKSKELTLPNQQAMSSSLLSNYDKIYSDFDDFSSRNRLKLKPSATTDHQTSTKHATRTKEAHQLQHLPSHQLMSNYSIQQGKQKQCPLSQVGNRLYNYGYYIKNKIEFLKRREEQEMNSKMKPNILKSPIDWSHSSHSLIKCHEPPRRVQAKEADFTFKPSINAKSLTIAKRLEPSHTRLMRKKKRSKSKSFSRSRGSIELSYDWPNISNADTSKCKSSSKSPPRRIKELYKEGLKHLKERTELFERNKKQKEEEYKYYSFKPRIASLEYGTGIDKGSKSNDPHTEQVTCKKKVALRNQTAREKKESEVHTQCTFRPNITPLLIGNDEKVIMRNVGHMNAYVNRRRQNIQREREQEEYAQRRLGNSSSFQVRATIPKEFVFRTKSRSKSNPRCCSIDSRNLLASSSHSPSQVLYMRESLGTDSFFAMNGSEVISTSVFKTCFIKDINDLQVRIANLNL